MEMSDNESMRLLSSMFKYDPGFSLKETELKRIKTALVKKQQQEALALAPPVASTTALIDRQTIETTNRETLFERELASMKEELLSQMNIITKSINDRSQIDSVGQIAAMIKWDIRFDAGNYYRLSIFDCYFPEKLIF